jgi:PAS domain S-box-containing protein
MTIMNTNKLDYIDFEEVNTLLEGFNKTTGFVTAILDLKGNVLSRSGWRQICTDFHRINPTTSRNCSISDTVLANKLSKDEKYHFYECLNGLVDVAVPIVINGEHIANLFSGQFFFNEPDREFFKKQARKHGFNEQEYLKALEIVPVVSKEKVKVAMDFLLNMTQMISEITFKKMEQSELNEALRKSEERSRSALDNMLEGCQIIGYDRRYIYLNRTAEIHNRRPNDELIGNCYKEIWPGMENTGVFKIIEQVLEKRVSDRLETKFIFPDGSHGWFDMSIQPVPEGVFILSNDITERKRKEEQLYESEFRFSKLYENGPFGMVMADKEFRFRKANQVFCTILGYTETEILNFTFKDITHPDDLKKDLPNIQKLIQKEIQVYKTEKRYIRKDGRVIWGSLSVTATYDSEGQFLYNLGIIEDITWRKQSEEELRKSKKMLSETESIGKVGGWEFNIDTMDQTWTEEVYRIHEVDFDFNPNVDKGIKFYTPASKPILEQAVRRVIEFGEPFDMDLEIITAKGNLRKVHSVGKPDLENRRVYGFFQDITEREQAQEKIRQKDQEFRKLSANVPDLIYQFTRRTDGTYFVPIASEGIRNIFGCSPEDVLDDFGPISRVIYPEDMERVIRAIEYSAKHMTFFNCEFRVQLPGREIQWIYSNSTPERLPDGSVTWYGFNVDITQKKLVEEALRESEGRFRKLNEKLEERVEERTIQLREANQELEAFSYSVSHDLRSPLRHINGFAEILAKQYSHQLPEDARKHLNTITASAKRMGTLIDDLLSFSRTGRSEFKKSTLKMNQVIEEALIQIKPSIKDRKIDWKISRLPDVLGDYNLIRSVWINLLDNAAKYTRFREKAVIQIGFKEEKRETVFFIKDNGAGFDMKYAHKLFGVFQRLHSSTQFEGTGIGLANVRRIVLRHGGRTWAEAIPDKGATFYFSIPKEMGDNL